MGVFRGQAGRQCRHSSWEHAREACSRSPRDQRKQIPKKSCPQWTAGYLRRRYATDPEQTWAASSPCACWTIVEGLWLRLKVRRVITKVMSRKIRLKGKRTENVLRLPSAVSRSCWRREPTCLGVLRFPVTWKI